MCLALLISIIAVSWRDISSGAIVHSGAVMIFISATEVALACILIRVWVTEMSLTFTSSGVCKTDFFGNKHSMAWSEVESVRFWTTVSILSKTDRITFSPFYFVDRRALYNMQEANIRGTGAHVS